MLGATVNVPDLGIENAKVIVVIDRLGGYKHYKVQFNPKDDEINPSTIAVHEDEITVVDDSETKELGDPTFTLGDKVRIIEPLSLEGVIGGIAHNSSGCIEYEVYYKTDDGIVTHTLPGELLQTIGTAATPGTQKGSMNRSVERRM